MESNDPAVKNTDERLIVVGVGWIGMCQSRRRVRRPAGGPGRRTAPHRECVPRNAGGGGIRARRWADS